MQSPIASDLSYEVLQRRARNFELSAPEPDSTFRNLYPITQGVERHSFMADRSVGVDFDLWERRRIAQRLGER